MSKTKQPDMPWTDEVYQPVWCLKCGAQLQVIPEKCIKLGWPTCCGETMTIDAPDEDTP